MSKKKITYVLVCLLISVIVSIYGRELIHENENAINVIVTVFSILAGFLVAIIAFIGDSFAISATSWRSAEKERTVFFKRLARHQVLFYCYLISLLLIFVSVLLKDKLPQLQIYIEHTYLFLSCFAFLLSLSLPSAIMKCQEERVDKIIESKRNEAGIKKDNE